jgi:hypothetical protein
MLTVSASEFVPACRHYDSPSPHSTVTTLARKARDRERKQRRKAAPDTVATVALRQQGAVREIGRQKRRSEAPSIADKEAEKAKIAARRAKERAEAAASEARGEPGRPSPSGAYP